MDLGEHIKRYRMVQMNGTNTNNASRYYVNIYIFTVPLEIENSQLWKLKIASFATS